MSEEAPSDDTLEEAYGDKESLDRNRVIANRFSWSHPLMHQQSDWLARTAQAQLETGGKPSGRWMRSFIDGQKWFNDLHDTIGGDLIVRHPETGRSVCRACGKYFRHLV